MVLASQGGGYESYLGVSSMINLHDNNKIRLYWSQEVIKEIKIRHKYANKETPPCPHAIFLLYHILLKTNEWKRVSDIEITVMWLKSSLMSVILGY